MKYTSKDVVVTLPEFGERTFAIVSAIDNQYYAISMKGHKHYWLEEDQIAEKIGTLPDDSPILELYDNKKGTEFALSKVESSKSPDKEKWEVLACLVPGDLLEVYHKKFIRKAVFVQLNLNKPKLVFRARVEGRAFDFPLEAVHVEQK